MRRALLLFLVAGAALAASVSYSANIAIYNDPPGTGGATTGTLKFLGDTADRTKAYRWVDYKLGATEVLNSPEKESRMKCSSCYTQNLPNGADAWLKMDTDVATGAPDTTCTKTFTRTADPNGINAVYTQGGALCRVDYTSGKYVLFTNVQTQSYTATDFAIPASWNCPAKVCNMVMDLVLILDESGSIGYTGWDHLRNFCKSLVSSFSVTPSAVNVGITKFATQARHISWLDFSKPNVLNTISSIIIKGGNTCIGCGLEQAYEIFNHGSSRVPATTKNQRVAVLVTDGANNVGSVDTGLKHLKSVASNIVAVGVGDDVNGAQLDAIATSGSYISVSDFSSLSSALQQIVGLTCTDLPVYPCGATCEGFCSCGGVCQCKDIGPNTPCQTHSCSSSSNYNWVSRPLECDDKNKCTEDSCDPSNNKCVNKDISSLCTAPDSCSTAKCEPSVGCTTLPYTCPPPTKSCAKVKCDKNQLPGSQCVTDTSGCTGNCNNVSACPAKACQSVTCTPALNEKVTCTYADIVCTPSNCYTPKCDPSSSTCVYELISCEDNEPCTTESCDPTSGKCVYTNVTCDDHDPCTVDECVRGLGNAGASQACNHTHKCTSDDRCKIASCQSDGTCVTKPYECPNNLTTQEDSCYTISCSSTGPIQCVKQIIPAAFINVCGECVTTFGKDGEVTVVNSTCTGGVKFPDYAAAITAGAIAGIVIAAVAGFFLLAGSGSYGVYKLVHMAGATKGMTTHANPIHQATVQGGTNAGHVGA